MHCCPLQDTVLCSLFDVELNDLTCRYGPDVVSALVPRSCRAGVRICLENTKGHVSTAAETEKEQIR